MLCRFLLMIASSDESTIASYRSSDGMKSDLRLIVEKSSQNRNPKDFWPRTNVRTDGEFGILEYFGPRSVVGNFVSELGQMVGLVFLTKRLEIGSKELGAIAVDCRPTPRLRVRVIRS